MKTLCDYVLEMPSRDPKQEAVRYHKNGKWISENWPTYFAAIEKLGAFLLSQGIQPGDHVAVLSQTRYEWSVADYAILGVRGATVPIYQNSTPEEVTYILNNSESKILIMDSKAGAKIWPEIASRCPTVQTVISMDEPGAPGMLGFAQALELGQDYLKKHPPCFRKTCGSSQIGDVASIVYTSGTTGTPKGVVLTHTQIMSEVADTFEAMEVTSKDLSLTFLPYAHVLGRVEHWGHVYVGYTMAFAQSIEKIKYNLPEVRPTIMMGVPRIFEKILSSIVAELSNNPTRSKIFNWASKTSKKTSRARHAGKTLSLLAKVEHGVARKLVLDKVRKALGGRLRFAVLGGAPLNRELAEFFHGAGILLLEGYGLTETTAAICVNTPAHHRFGTVGRPLHNVELRIAEDGEILVRSPKVMTCYYKNPEATAAVLNDGWFATGDIGEILETGELRITDRKKDLIKTGGGKYVAPQKLESLLIQKPLISHAVIHGDSEKYVVALVTLDRAELRQFARNRGISEQDHSKLCANEQIKAYVNSLFQEVNAELADHEKIRKHYILPAELTVANGELTANLKVRRKFCEKKFETEIRALYK